MPDGQYTTAHWCGRIDVEEVLSDGCCPLLVSVNGVHWDSVTELG